LPMNELVSFEEYGIASIKNRTWYLPGIGAILTL
jgi:hypothetical protein